MSANKNAEVSLPAEGASASAGPVTRGRRVLPLAVYGLAAGSVTTAAGLWASSRLSGTARLVAWIGVTAVLAIGAMWGAEPAIGILGRCYQRGRRGPRASR